MIYIESDYMEGAHPQILKRLNETNLEKTTGYGEDGYCASAKEKIRETAGCPDAAVYFLIGGTQTNAVVLSSLLRPYQGVISAGSGHVCNHEAGAIERTGHKVIAIPHENGKISAEGIAATVKTWMEDGNRTHVVMPGAVYISQPTEYGTIYSLSELKAISEVCRSSGLYLYIDGARLAYALACPKNDADIKDIAALCDAFYIGGTKCGALLGEAVVFPHGDIVPGFFSYMKQSGAVLAKGRILGLQFDTLFSDNLYYEVGKPAMAAAARLRQYFAQMNITEVYGSPTNQIFVVWEDSKLDTLAQEVDYSYIERYDETHTVIRFCTSWATTDEDIDKLIEVMNGLI